MIANNNITFLIKRKSVQRLYLLIFKLIINLKTGITYTHQGVNTNIIVNLYRVSATTINLPPNKIFKRKAFKQIYLLLFFSLNKRLEKI